MRTDKLNLKIKKILGDSAKKMIVKLLFPMRNQFILFNISNRAVRDKVNLNYWNESENLGDALAPVIVNYMLSLKGISPEQTVKGRRHLYAVGSVLTAGIQDATVWGSGVLNAKLTYRLEKRKLDVRAVRGPVTRMVLMDYGYSVPAIYGDPAMILPEIYSPKPVPKTKKYGLIVHKDYDTSKIAAEIDDDILPINICTADYEKFVDQIQSVEMIISSSLHGIIIAEAYKVPAVLLRPQIDILKYYDYYYSTNRLTFPMADTLNEAKQIQPAALPELEELKAKLKDVFPYDLYR